MNMMYKRAPKEIYEYTLNVKPFSEVYLVKFKLLKKHIKLITKVKDKDEALLIRQEILDDIKLKT
jgi:hypothetical protein